jgi:hypothetical protein
MAARNEHVNNSETSVFEGHDNLSNIFFCFIFVAHLDMFDANCADGLLCFHFALHMAEENKCIFYSIIIILGRLI